jgi:hypothetical protein
MSPPRRARLRVRARVVTADIGDPLAVEQLATEVAGSVEVDILVNARHRFGKSRCRDTAALDRVEVGHHGSATHADREVVWSHEHSIDTRTGQDLIEMLQRSDGLDRGKAQHLLVGMLDVGAVWSTVGADAPQRGVSTSARCQRSVGAVLGVWEVCRLFDREADALAGADVVS